jgi:hypothetical protein
LVIAASFGRLITLKSLVFMVLCKWLHISTAL